MNTKQQMSFVLLRGILLKNPIFRENERSSATATLVVGEETNRVLVKLRGPARLETVRGWKEGDQVMVMGNPESQFNTRAKSHTVHVRAVILFLQEDVEGDDWDEFGLSAMLGRMYQKLADG